MINDKLQIRLKAYRRRVGDELDADKTKTAKRLGARVAGPIPLPTVKNKWAVLTPLHTGSKSREQLEIRVHKRLMEILDPTTHTVEVIVEDQKADELAQPYFEKIAESRKQARRVQTEIKRLKRKTQAIIENLP